MLQQWSTENASIQFMGQFTNGLQNGQLKSPAV